MPLRLRCPQCSNDIHAADELCGRKVRCPHCWESFLAVASAPAAPPPAAAPRPAPAPEGHGLLVIGLTAATVLLLLILAGGGFAAWWFWPRPAPSVAAVTPPVTAKPVDDNPTANPAADQQPTPKPAPMPDPAAPPMIDPQPAQPPAHQPQPPADLSQFHLADVRKSVVFIRRSTGALALGTGTGFFVTADGLVATNRHVIQSETGPNPATVLYVGVPSADDPDKLDYFRAQVAYCPPTTDTLDFALLKITAKPGYQQFRPLPLAPAGAKVRLGDPVAAIGFPFADPDHPELSFNKGSISSTRKEIDDRPYYQTDAAINPGNSGGPLINADGQVVGIVSRKRDDANNMGFALYLGETGLPGLLNGDKVARVSPEAGPLDSKRLPAASLPTTHLADWDVTHGQTVDPKDLKNKELIVAHNDGAAYWLTYNDPLPENFQLSVECFVLPIVPDRPQMPQLPFGPPRGFGPPIMRPPIGPSRERVNLNVLQSLYVRFGDDAANDDIVAMRGTTVHLSAALLRVGENGAIVATQHKGVPDDPFVLTLTRRGDELTIAVDGETRLTQKLQRALPGPHKFSVGGVQSALVLHAVSISPIDGPPVPPPLAEAPRPPAGPPASLSFDNGWDKPADPDGDCKITPNKGSLTIEVPGGKRHDLLPDRNVINAPRLVRDVGGDFTAQVKVDGDFTPAEPSTNPEGVPFLGAGLVVTSGDQTVLRLERAALIRNGAVSAYVNWEAHAPGVKRTGTSGLRPDEPAVYLRLRRQGDRFFASFSRDGTGWTDLPPQEVKLPDGVKVGVAAVTTSAGALKATYDDFRLGASGEAPQPPPPPPADPKIWAARPPADWKGPEWTSDLDKMKFPDGAPSGWLMGAEFKAEDVSFSPIGWLTLRQGPPGPAAVGEVVVILREHALADLEGKTLTVTGKQDQFPPIFGNARRVTAERQQKVEPLGDFFMKLEFGKLKDGKLPGKIYLCLPDDAKSVIAGTFQLESK